MKIPSSNDSLKNRRFNPLLFAVVALLFVGISGCAPGANTAAITNVPEPAGFLLGLWHGLIVIITFIVSLFTDSVNVYEVQNNGTFYNLGFVIGLTISLGGSGKSASRRRAD